MTRVLRGPWRIAWLAAWLAGPLAAQSIPAWELVWADEFTQPDGTGPNPAVWNYDVGGDGWGNHELQYYTRDRRENARIQSGQLILEARQETYTSGGQTWDYTSARLNTAGRREILFGRVEARLQLPTGRGLWPAFWLLGRNISTVGWPACGEIDIMENIGSETNLVHASAHGPAFYGDNSVTADSRSVVRAPFYADFHLYALEWSPGRIRISVDNHFYFDLQAGDYPPSAWVFDQPFFLLLNVAVGGDWPGKPVLSTVFPQQLRVDYVRVYRQIGAPPPALQLRCHPDRVELLWPAAYPQARVQSSDPLGLQWTDLPLLGNLEGNSFVRTVEPGFFRLIW